MSDNELMLDVGQANEIKLAARRAGATNADLKRLSEGDIFAKILPIIRGLGEVAAIKSVIDAKGVRGENEFLKLISPEALIIGPTDGSEILADASDIFAVIDSDFRRWKADEPGAPAGETPVGVYEIAEDVAFMQMFRSLSADISRLCLTQAQIIGFVKQHRNWLRTDGYATFFLFKSYGQFFVAVVRVVSGWLKVYVYRFEFTSVWNARHRHRLVVPATGLTP